MAERKLNKKVAITGILVLIALTVAAGYVFLQMRKNPHKLLAEAAEELKVIESLLDEYRRVASDPEASQPDMQQKKEQLLERGKESYMKFFRKYRQAVGAASDDSLRIRILFELSEHYLTANEFHPPDWEKALRAWYTITTIDPANTEAGLKLLRFYYDSGDAGNPVAWSRVKDQVSGTEPDGSDGLIQIMLEQNKKPDSFVLKAKARADLELAASGLASDRAGSVDEAIKGFEDLLRETPDDVELYRFLARAIRLRGDIRSAAGQNDAVEESVRQAEEVLRKAVALLPEDAQAHINLLEMKLQADQGDAEKVRALEADFLALVEKFDTSAAAWASLSGYYRFVNKIDKALEAITRARELDGENLEYAISAADILYLKSSLAGDNDFRQAIDIANEALEMPHAQMVSGPRRTANLGNRLMLYSFLARIHVEQALEALREGNDEKHALLVAKVQQCVHEMTQILGSTNVISIMWAGILDLARGQDDKAVRQMYDAYEQLKAGGRNDAVLSYMLAEAFRNRPEIGSRLEFLGNAIQGGITRTRPQVMLDYARLLQRVGNSRDAIGVVQAYERIVGASQESRTIQVTSYIKAGRFDEAAAILESMDADAGQTKGLRLSLVNARILSLTRLQGQISLTSQQRQQLDKDRRERFQLVEELIIAHPEQVPLGVVALVCRDYVGQNKPDRARLLMEKFLAHGGEDVAAQMFQRSLMEPDPNNVDVDRIEQINLQVLSDIADPLRRAVLLGEYHLMRGRYSEAAEQFGKALEIAPDDERAINGLFEAALSQEGGNLELAEQMARKARSNNLDGCEGNLYLARVSLARGDYAEALDRVEQCLNSRPVWARAYNLRSRIYEAMDNLEQAIKDAQTAAAMNPLDVLIARQRVAVLHKRNTRLGRKLSIEEQEETEQALRMAIALDIGNWRVQSLYAQYRSAQHPEEALARFQVVRRQAPTAQNNLLFADLATRMSRNETDPQKKATLLEMAAAAYKKAFELDPQNKNVQYRYSEFLRLTGRQSEAESLFAGRDDVLWQFYMRDGRYDKAAKILHALYEKDPRDAAVIRGLVQVASLTGDRDGVAKYCRELLEVEKTEENHLLQIEKYLETGLVEEARLKLAAFRERNPQDPRGLLLEAWTARAQGDLDRALDLVNRNLELDSENASALRLRGNIYRLLGDYNRAIDDLRESKRLNANATVSLELALAYREANKITHAIGELRDAIKDPMAPMRLWSTLERFYLEAGRKNALATFYEDCIAKYPDSELWHYRAAEFYWRQEDYGKAEEYLRKAWQITQKKANPTPEVFDLYLQVLWLKGDYQKVMEIASRYIDTPRLASVAYAQMGQAQARMNNRQLAVQYYHQALEKSGSDNQQITGTVRNMTEILGAEEVDKWVASKLRSSPDSLTANMVAFHLASQSRQYNKALQHIEKSLAAVSSSDPAHALFSQLKGLTLVRAYLKTGDRQYMLQAIDTYREILKRQPRNYQVLNNLAFLLADNDEQLDKAEEYGALAHALTRNNPVIMDTYAYTLCKNGKYRQAEKILLAAVQLHEVAGSPVPRDIYRHLGMAYEGLGQNAQAADAYSKAMEIGGDTITQEEKKALTEAIKRVSQ